MSTDKKNSVSYNDTMNLPATDFPMRASLPKREPEMLEKWEEQSLYEKVMENNADKPVWILHDGPPYANASIHIGTAMNKLIKDFIVRYRNMSGYKAPYVPGWDTHGLPIELRARESVGTEKASEMSPSELRKLCHNFALQFVDDQRTQFKRIGCIGQWDKPYLTLNNEFVARQIQVFSDMALKGYIYKGLKPVYWCPQCVTALAEAEIEYEEDPVYSIYVKFEVSDDKGVLTNAGIDPQKTSFVIWTTTTWTLPANTGIALGPNYEYAAVKVNDSYLIIAKELVKQVMQDLDIQDYSIEAEFIGDDLEFLTAKHPFLDRVVPILTGSHVTLETGTGAVHNAPGHGIDDYNMLRKYPDLEIIVPVDDHGIMTEEAGEICAGMNIDDAGRALAKAMEESGALLATQRITHQYPHCWRCKSPVLFRATEQWFASVESIKDKAIEAVNSVKWMPEWGQDRMATMIKDRADWCISRQRLWGVPIPMFYCSDCDEPVIEKSFFDAVIKLFSEKGDDTWFELDASDILPQNAKCPHCNGTKFYKETDTMDVWFDAGTSHASVLDSKNNPGNTEPNGKWPDLHWPADLYMEGTDQYRGWFQSSLLTAVAWRGESPYKAVLTHGWTVDGEGKKMSKSLGNVVLPEEVVEQYGADILRLWVASLDYRNDVRISKDILKQLSESYRKIRNTARFMLSNLGDFDPDKHIVESYDELEEIDKWALARLDNLVEKVVSAFERYEFHDAMHRIHNFCVVDMSNFYLDVLKDRLYVEGTDSKTRRAAQSTVYILLSAITRMLAPFISYTAEEIWEYMPHKSTDNVESVMLNDFPKYGSYKAENEFMEKWSKIHDIRDEVTKALEETRRQKLIGGSLDAKVTLMASGQQLEFIKSVEDLLPMALIVSAVEIKQGKGEFEIEVTRAKGEKCARCWTYSSTVGTMPHDDICERCEEVLSTYEK